MRTLVKIISVWYEVTKKEFFFFSFKDILPILISSYLLYLPVAIYLHCHIFVACVPGILCRKILVFEFYWDLMGC
jgi:hypothetical protein